MRKTRLEENPDMENLVIALSFISLAVGFLVIGICIGWALHPASQPVQMNWTGISCLIANTSKTRFMLSCTRP